MTQVYENVKAMNEREILSLFRKSLAAKNLSLQDLRNKISCEFTHSHCTSKAKYKVEYTGEVVNGDLFYIDIETSFISLILKSFRCLEVSFVKGKKEISLDVYLDVSVTDRLSLNSQNYLAPEKLKHYLTFAINKYIKGR